MKYEAMYIVQPNLEEDTRVKLINEINSIFGGEKEVQEWKLRDLAYEIDDFKKGYYVIINTVATVDEINEFERVCKIKENVLRFMIVKVEE